MVSVPLCFLKVSERQLPNEGSFGNCFPHEPPWVASTDTLLLKQMLFRAHQLVSARVSLGAS